MCSGIWMARWPSSRAHAASRVVATSQSNQDTDQRFKMTCNGHMRESAMTGYWFSSLTSVEKSRQSAGTGKTHSLRVPAVSLELMPQAKLASDTQNPTRRAALLLSSDDGCERHVKTWSDQHCHQAQKTESNHNTTELYAVSLATYSVRIFHLHHGCIVLLYPVQLRKGKASAITLRCSSRRSSSEVDCTTVLSVRAFVRMLVVKLITTGQTDFETRVSRPKNSGTSVVVVIQEGWMIGVQSWTIGSQSFRLQHVSKCSFQEIKAIPWVLSTVTHACRQDRYAPFVKQQTCSRYHRQNSRHCQPSSRQRHHHDHFVSRQVLLPVNKRQNTSVTQRWFQQRLPMQRDIALFEAVSELCP